MSRIGRLPIAVLAKFALEVKLKSETIDVTLPAKKREFGHSHPNIIALHEVEKIFTNMGYEVVEGKRQDGYGI